MTRKRYQKKITALVVAIAKDPRGDYKGKLGESIRHARANTTNVPKTFGSYKAAYDALAEAFEFYGV